ncbi:glycoside hydrolase family 13 protein [Melanogaster broomeanus]|nr:glycoside hydrolase family 13 protein [Melanogaster broomeanus]
MLYSVIFSLTFVSFFCWESSAADAQQWRSALHLPVTDRFALDVSDGTAYNVPCNTSVLQYCGGTWRGIINQLDYIQGMGFDAVWISPPFANVEGPTPFGELIMGAYWPQDLTSLNPHFGTANDLKNLSASLHSRGMYLMLDVVVNHMVSSRPINTTAMYPFTDLSNFHDLCWITDFSDQTQTFDTENPQVIETLNNWVTDVISDFGVDGLRLSTVKYVSKHFWSTFTAQAGVFTMGEVFSVDPKYTSPYTEVMDAVIDYPTWFELAPAFLSPQDDFNALKDIVKQSQDLYTGGTFMTGSFLENHAHPRFGSLTNDTARQANALVWPFIHDGIPILYYGLSGGERPSNQEALWKTRYDPEHAFYTMVTSLNKARKAAIASEEYFLITPMQFLDANAENTLVVSKPPMLALLTNIGSQQMTSVRWNVTHPVFKRGEHLVDILTCRSYFSGENGGVSIQSDEGMPKVSVPILLHRTK